MTKLEMLNALKLNLTAKNIEFKNVIANKMIEINHLALANSSIEIKVSCEKDECGVYLKVHTNDDCLGLFETNSDTEYTSAVKLAKKINRAIQNESAWC